MGQQDITSSVTGFTNKENPTGILAKMSVTKVKTGHPQTSTKQHSMPKDIYIKAKDLRDFQKTYFLVRPSHRDDKRQQVKGPAALSLKGDSMGSTTF